MNGRGAATMGRRSPGPRSERSRTASVASRGAALSAPLSIATFLAAVGGILNALAFPGLGWWPLIFVGTPLILFSLVGRTVWSSLLVGLLAGLAFWGTHIFWLTIYLGPVPWAALSGLESVFFALGCALIALAWRFGARVLSDGILRLAVLPAVVAGLWLLRESITSTWPYGGFSWGRLAMSQSESPFAGLMAWVGMSGLSFLIAWVSALIVAVALAPSASARVLRSLVPLALLGLMVVVPAFPIVVSGTARIGAVQGDADAGLFAQYTPGEILVDHVAASQPLYGERMDLAVWPENASDLDPLRVPEAARTLDTVAESLGAPLITGTITVDGDDIFNSLLLWRSGQGSVDQYDKIHPVPFAEYLPDREFWTPLAPDLFALIPRDYTIGTRGNVFEIPDARSPLRAGLAICFDIVDDALVRQMIAQGANVIIAPTNNADFGESDESVQQLAIARLRAIETGRSLVNASTVGTSAMIAPDGTTIDQLPTFEPGTMLHDVPLSTTTTPATAIGLPLELTLGALGLLGLIALGILTTRKRSTHG